jgi:hypothetical protein
MVPDDPFWVWSQQDNNSPWFSGNETVLKKGQYSWAELISQLERPLITLRNTKLGF